MFYRAPFMSNCIYCGRLFLAHTAGTILCPKCVEGSRPEYEEKGTFFGMEIKEAESTNHLLKLHVVTNTAGAKAVVHIAWDYSVFRAGHAGIKALCGNPLKHVSDVRPLVNPSSLSIYETHKAGEPRWCPVCERSLRKLMGGERTHAFATAMIGGYPNVLGWPVPRGRREAMD